MKRSTASLADDEFDLLIIGGGAFGAAAAWDATLRGLRTALIERDDFGSGASAECFKVVHGGIRYLQHADIGRLRFSCAQRSALLRIAPHLVSPLPILIPTYGFGRKGKAFLGTGMRMYDLLTCDRNRGIADSSRRIPSTRFMGRAETLEIFPDLDGHELTGGAIFDDGQMYNPPRLVLAFVKSAAAKGAIVGNYVEAKELLWSGNRVCGARVRDRLNGDEFDIRARLVLNAAGPGAEYLLNHERFGKWQRGPFSRDACFVIKRRMRSKYALAIQGKTRDKDAMLAREARHMFLVPWRDYTLVGVWHKIFAGHPDTAHVEGAELDAWIAEMNACYPTLALRRDEVTYANCGLVPFGDVGPDQALSFGKESRFIDHSTVHNVTGMLTLIGIRFTTCRGDAATALDMLLKQLPKSTSRPDTAHIPLVGGSFGDFEELRADAHKARPTYVPIDTLEALLRNHGTDYQKIVKDAGAEAVNTTLVPGSDTLTAEISYAVRNEMAVRLEDVVFRRTNLGSATHPGEAALAAVANRMQVLLDWSEQQRSENISAADATLRRHQAMLA